MLTTFSGRRPSQMEDELNGFINLMREHGVKSYGEIGAREGDTFHHVLSNLPGCRGVAMDLPGGLWGKLGIKIQRNTAHFFGNRSTPSGILVAPGNISPENAKSLKEAWEAGYTGQNAGKVAVLGDGLKFEPMSQKATDSQLIETLRWSDERICSVFHVPAYKVGVGQPPSYNNIEALDRAYYSDCLQSPIEEMEACQDDGFGLDGISQGVELDLKGLLRMDTKTQMESLKLGTEAGLVTPNEGRRDINLPPLEGGDTVYMQQQDYPLDEVRNNKIANEPASPPATTSAAEAPIAEISDEDKAVIAEARSIVATQKAIAAMRKAVQPEVANV